MTKSMKEFLTIWLGEESASKMYEVLKKLPDGCDVQLHNTGSNNVVLSIPIDDDFYEVFDEDDFVGKVTNTELVLGSEIPEKLIDKILNNVILVKCSIKGDNSANKPESMNVSKHKDTYEVCSMYFEGLDAFDPGKNVHGLYVSELR